MASSMRGQNYTLDGTFVFTKEQEKIMVSKSEKIIQQAKDIKQTKNLQYSDIMKEIRTENGVPVVSLTTLKRVLADGSENRASRFNYEETLLPILDAIKRIDGDSDDAQPTEEIKALKMLIDLQNEELARKDALTKRLIDRLDQKDEIIKQFILDMKQKDSFIHQLTEKIL